MVTRGIPPPAKRARKLLNLLGHQMAVYILPLAEAQLMPHQLASRFFASYLSQKCT
jgi:hypothetical protein